jgi:chromosome segregation ATPase
MADAQPAEAPRHMTEHEAYAIAADRVVRETADLNEKVSKLESDVTELKAKLDVSEAAVATEKAARETADKALADFKAEAETQKEIAARRGEREKKVREVAKHMKDDWFSEERIGRWASMEDAQFGEYIAEIAALGGSSVPAGTPPRETAMVGAPVVPAGSGDTGPMERMFAHRRGVTVNG